MSAELTPQCLKSFRIGCRTGSSRRPRCPPLGSPVTGIWFSSTGSSVTPKLAGLGMLGRTVFCDHLILRREHSGTVGGCSDRTQTIRRSIAQNRHSKKPLAVFSSNRPIYSTSPAALQRSTTISFWQGGRDGTKPNGSGLRGWIVVRLFVRHSLDIEQHGDSCTGRLGH